jgi:hypothetical protein
MEREQRFGINLRFAMKRGFPEHHRLRGNFAQSTEFIKHSKSRNAFPKQAEASIKEHRPRAFLSRFAPRH